MNEFDNEERGLEWKIRIRDWVRSVKMESTRSFWKVISWMINDMVFYGKLKQGDEQAREQESALSGEQMPTGSTEAARVQYTCGVVRRSLFIFSFLFLMGHAPHRVGRTSVWIHFGPRHWPITKGRLTWTHDP